LHAKISFAYLSNNSFNVKARVDDGTDFGFVISDYIAKVLVRSNRKLDED
jgi:hypothetical protein